MDIAAQIVGIIGSVLIVGSFQVKSNRWLYIFQLSGNLMFTVNFFLLGAYTGSILNAISFFRCVVLALGKKWSRPWVCILFQILFIAAGVLTYGGYVSILITVSQITTTAAMWTRKGKLIRLANFFVNSPTWLVNNIYYFSLGGIITEAVSLVSVLVSFIRFGFNGFEDNEIKQERSKGVSL